MRDEASRTFIRPFSKTSGAEVTKIFKKLASEAAKTLDQEGVPRKDQSTSYQVDIRYHGQGLLLTVDFELADLQKRGLEASVRNSTACMSSCSPSRWKKKRNWSTCARWYRANRPRCARSRSPRAASPSAAEMAERPVYMDGKDRKAKLYDRSKLKAGNVIKGPAVVLEMDSTTVILNGHVGKVDKFGTHPDHA